MVGVIELGLPNWQLCAEHHQPRYAPIFIFYSIYLIYFGTIHEGNSD
jgi:hypothetical protein